jgi:hypothetical protein
MRAGFEWDSLEGGFGGAQKSPQKKRQTKKVEVEFKRKKQTQYPRLSNFWRFCDPQNLPARRVRDLAPAGPAPSPVVTPNHPKTDTSGFRATHTTLPAFLTPSHTTCQPPKRAAHSSMIVRGVPKFKTLF